MEQRSEQINLEYKVEFEDGLRRRVHVYGIDSEAGEVYGARVYIGVLVGAGTRVRLPSEKEVKERYIGALVNMGAWFDSSWVIHKERRRLPGTKDWEQKECEENREHGWNVIKIQDPEHIKPAIHRHVELYTNQFDELAERFANLFQGFIEEHPGYGKH